VVNDPRDAALAVALARRVQAAPWPRLGAATNAAARPARGRLMQYVYESSNSTDSELLQAQIILRIEGWIRGVEDVLALTREIDALKSERGT
jgi:hypothetical protein